MGFSSFLTSDTQESILNIYTKQSKIVYMLQPNGLAHIVEPAYEGYMEFGGVDVFEWIVTINTLDSLFKDKDFKSVGIALEVGGGIYVDSNTHKKYSYHYANLSNEIISFTNNYSSLQEGYEYSPNELIKKGIWREISIRDLINID